MNGLANWLLGFCVGLGIAGFIPQPWRAILQGAMLLTAIIIIWVDLKVIK